MGTKRFMLLVLAVAVVGAGVAYGVRQLVPGQSEEPPLATAELPVPRTGESGSAAGAPSNGEGSPDGAGVERVLESLPEEVRRQMEDNPELEAQVRARIGAAIESGGIGSGLGAAEGGPFGGGRTGEPLTGTVVSFSAATLRLDTPDGVVDIAAPPDTPVIVAKTAAEAGAYLLEGSEVSVGTRVDEGGGLTAVTVLTGAPEGLGGLAGLVTGSISSFADGALSLETDAGQVDVSVPGDTPVQVRLTAADAAAELTEGSAVTAFVQREADGRFAAANIVVGEPGGRFGGGFLGRGRQQGAGGDAGQ